jgi:hypothetical protein
MTVEKRLTADFDIPTRWDISLNPSCRTRPHVDVKESQPQEKKSTPTDSDDDIGWNTIL